MDAMPPDHDDPDDCDDPDPDTDGRGHSVADPVLGKSRLLTRQCATCIFRPGNLMNLREGRLRDLVDATRAAQSFIVCHSTLPHFRYPDVEPAICRGFADNYSTQALQVIERLWGFVEVDPPGEQPDTAAAEPDHHTPRP